MKIYTLLEAFAFRADGLHQWLRDNHPHIKGVDHFPDGTTERIYWHFGYMVAMCDVVRNITGLILDPENYPPTRDDSPSTTARISDKDNYN